jgi:maltokinase
MTRVDLTQVPTYLKAQRWFGGKAWPIKQVSVGDHVGIDLPADGRWRTPERALLAVVDVTYELGQPERYVLPIVPRTDGMADALEYDEFPRALLRLIVDGGSIPSGVGALKAVQLPSADSVLSTLGERPNLRRLGVEQSNTSIAFADRVILKLLRKLEPGLSPEYEMGRFLLEKKFHGAPALLGALRLEGPTDALIAIAHEFIPARSDGWGFLLQALKEPGAPTPVLLQTVKDLGTRVAELHGVLASDAGDPAFAPEPILLEDLQRWSSSIIGELGVTLSLAGDQVPGLAERRSALIARVGRLAHVAPSGLKTRVHGDLHLGQVLHSPERGWMIFDFEGEPARNFSQRREKQSPLRDVAGMLRSFSYAVATIEKESGATSPRGNAGLQALRKAFLDGYLSTASGATFLPQGEALQTVMEVLELEKLLYELRYEVQNRPTWVDIPASALLAFPVE